MLPLELLFSDIDVTFSTVCITLVTNAMQMSWNAEYQNRRVGTLCSLTDHLLLRCSLMAFTSFDLAPKVQHVFVLSQLLALN